MDPLSDVLSVSGVRGTRPARIEAVGRWGVRWQHDPLAVVYAVVSGALWLAVRDREIRRVGAGDVVLLPVGIEHSLSSGPDVPLVPCDPADAVEASRTGRPLRFGADGDPDTVVLAAAYRHDPAVHTQILPLLPGVVHARADRTDATVGHAVRLLGHELTERRMASSVAVDRIVDLLLVQLLRVASDGQDSPSTPSLLAALDDALVASTLGRLHADPARPWTIGTLADCVSVSRTTLNRRFAAAVGEPVGAYLSRWRMDLASVRLRDSDDTLEAIARGTGYASVQAFSRAFSRARGVPPARYRQAARAEPPAGSPG
jgi:AraC-like DNA-binding protein